jgi:hypothetical protein
MEELANILLSLPIVLLVSESLPNLFGSETAEVNYLLTIFTWIDSSLKSISALKGLIVH